MKITSEEKDILLKAARQSIGSLFDGKEPEQPDYHKYLLLNEKLGAFVTLTINHQLRGCIGYIIGREPLFNTICSAAIHAAVNDPRFSALKKPELEKIHIEISILSEFVPIKSYDEIIIGKHGLYLDEGGGGLLLPQVATEHKMNREQFLSAICNKSGFYSDFWKERMLKLKVFTAEIFEEEEKGKEIMKIRHQQVAGYFYPAEKDKLQRDISLMLQVAKSEKSFKKIFGIVSPHAGYIYSGKTAAYVYNLLKDKSYKTVIIISPSHAEYFPGISIYDGDAYETPFGIVEIDQIMTDELVKNSKTIFRGIQGHRKEHALEVQIPFLQSVLKDFKIVPIVMGDQSRMFVDELAKRISKVVSDETLVVASSDMSHFYSSEEADRLDSVVEKRIDNFDFENLLKDLDNHQCEACGGGSIAAMMKAASLKSITGSLVINRSDSGDITGDKSEVVGYLSAVIYQD